MLGRGWPSVSTLAAPLVDDLVLQAQALRLGVQRHPSGAQVVDGGIDHIGSLEAGRRIAEICMAGLGKATLHMSARLSRWPATLSVSSDNPVLACLASQYAGWKLSHGSGEDAYFALGSGPARAQGSGEELFDRPPLPALLGLHRDAVGGVLPESLPVVANARALSVVYAGKDIRIDVDQSWPDWVCDRPQPNIRIDAHAPVCTVLASGATARDARERALDRNQRIMALCNVAAVR